MKKPLSNQLKAIIFSLAALALVSAVIVVYLLDPGRSSPTGKSFSDPPSFASTFIDTGEFASANFPPDSTDIIIPDSVVAIGPSAFKESNITSISFPSSLSLINSLCCYKCRSLSTVYIPASVTCISSFAFASCPSLSDIFFAGSKSQWLSIIILSDAFLNSPSPALHFAS